MKTQGTFLGLPKVKFRGLGGPFGVLRDGAIAVCLCLFAIFSLLPQSSPAASSSGTDFWIAFPANYIVAPQLTVFIAGATATSGFVTVPGMAINIPFSVSAGGIVSVTLPATVQLSSAAEAIEMKAIHVTSALPVSVYGLNRFGATTDAYLGLPLGAIGTEYRVMAYQNTNSLVLGSQMTVVATQNGTVVTITPAMSVTGHPAGVPFNITMSAGQAYHLTELATLGGDLSGSLVSSNVPVSVLGGHLCANIPNDSYCCCDHIVEQMFPTDTWGKQFVTLPLATRTGGDLFRIMASTNGTNVVINGVPQPPLAAGAFRDVILTAASVITSDQPISLAQYSQSTDVDNVTSDPFEMLVPPYEQFSNGYTISTPQSGFSYNFVNVVAPASAVGAITVDGVVVSPGLFTPIGASGFYGAKIPISLGSHRLDGPLPFGVSVYGFDGADSYGYPGGNELAPLATVASLTLTPKTASLLVGAAHCLTATVMDSNVSPVAGVRVDFIVTGANPRSGFAFTDAAGLALFCYTGTAAGSDLIRASLGTLSDTATADWTFHTPTITPTWSISPTFSVSPTITPTPSMSPSFTESFTSSPTPSQTPTRSNTSTLTASPTRTASPTPSHTRTLTVTFSDTPTATPTPTVTFTYSPTPTPSITQTFSATPSITPSPTITPTPSITPTFSPSPTAIPIQGDLGFGPVYPNPFREVVHVAILSKADQNIQLMVYNVAGEPVFQETLHIFPGLTMWNWPGTNNSGNRCASGSYLIRMAATEGTNKAPHFTWVVIAR